jgi:hypothetical protein
VGTQGPSGPQEHVKPSERRAWAGASRRGRPLQCALSGPSRVGTAAGSPVALSSPLSAQPFWLRATL